MARDVEFNYTASDKTGTAATSVERRMKQTGERVKRDSDKLSSDYAKNVVKLAETVSPKLAQSLTQGFASVAEVGPQLLLGGVVAVAPLAGAAVSAAIIGAAGAGGIIGGVLIASKDARVQAAFAGMKQHIGEELTDAAQPFVQTTIDGIDSIGSALDTIDFGAIFAKSAQNAKPVIAGISEAVRDLGDGVEALIEHSGPVMEQLGDSIGDLGQHAGQFFETVAGGSEGAAAGLKDLTSTVDLLLDITGPTVRGLTELYGWLSKIGVAGSFMTQLLGPIGQVGDLLEKAGIIGGHASGQLKLVQKGVGGVGDAAASSAGPVQTFTDRVDALAQEGHSLFDSTTQVGEAIDRVSAAAKKNGKTLDENTAKGRENRGALSELASALVAQYDATVKVNGEGAKSNKVAGENRASFVRLATQLGLSKDAAARLATQMGLIPAKKSTSFTANTHDAAARIEALKEQIGNVHGKTVTIDVKARLNKVYDQLNRLGGNFDASSSFAFAAEGQRSVEPARAPMSERLDNYINVTLDGSVIYTNTARQVRQASKRDAWRQKVGRR